MKPIQDLKQDFKYWDMLGDMIDQCIDITLNLSQSGHPGGSRSKMPALLTTLLSGAMRWDIRDQGRPFADRMVLVAGHTNPLFYATLAVFNEALRRKYQQTGDEKYNYKHGEEYMLTWEDLLTLRQHGGLPGHAEVIKKTLIFKCNTGPSGHGAPIAAGQAVALRHAGASDVKVFCFEGEFGFQSGVSQETISSAYGLGVGNLLYYLDWNNYGIDGRPNSDVVAGTPAEWFGTRGWKVTGSEEGENWEEIVKCYEELLKNGTSDTTPKALWLKNRKGRGYGVYDNASHGAPHKRNADLFWQVRKEFADKYGVSFKHQDAKAEGYSDCKVQMQDCLEVVMSLFDKKPELLDYLTDRLLEIAATVPEHEEIYKKFESDPYSDPAIMDIKNYPASFVKKPGEVAPNRKALADFGAWINTYVEQKHGRPMAIVTSADVAGSTNISGFAANFGELKGKGMFNKDTNPEGTLIPMGITEFANAGLVAGIASVNFARDPYNEYRGFLSACSTYSAFSYLKYGPMRIYSQIIQDSPLKMGRVIWVAGHAGPETGEDGRTHYGIFSPSVTKLFPKDKVMNIYPWEYNEVPVMLAEAFKTEIPIIVLHLTRPDVVTPDREALGMASHYDAAKGAYIVKDYDPSRPKEGVVILRGTSVIDDFIKILPRIKNEGPNVKVVAAVSHDLFRRQDQAYQESVVANDEWLDSMVVTHTSLESMSEWIKHPIVEEYSISADWNDEWLHGGPGLDTLEAARINDKWQWIEINRFAKERNERLERILATMPKA